MAYASGGVAADQHGADSDRRRRGDRQQHEHSDALREPRLERGDCVEKAERQLGADAAEEAGAQLLGQQHPDEQSPRRFGCAWPRRRRAQHPERGSGRDDAGEELGDRARRQVQRQMPGRHHRLCDGEADAEHQRRHKDADASNGQQLRGQDPVTGWGRQRRASGG